MNIWRRQEDNKIEAEAENVIRLAVAGCTNRKYYRVVVGPHYGPRDKYEIEQLGTFDPMPNIFNEKTCALNFERIKYHIGMGAHITRPVRRLLGLAGFLPLEPTLIFFAQHLRRRRLIEQKIKERDAEKEGEEQKETTA
ncbi:small ribosomal subunit protein bS16m-like [Styela clava]